MLQRDLGGDGHAARVSQGQDGHYIENCIVGRSGAKGRVAETCPARPKSPEGEYQGDSAIGEKCERV